MANRPIIIHGARVLVYINGKLLGRVVSFGWEADTAAKEIETIDLDIPAEIAPTRSRVNWHMQVLRTMGDGGAQGAGIAPQQVDARLGKYISIVLIERVSNLVIFKCDLARMNHESWTVAAKDRMLGNLRGTGITWNNEANQ